MKKILTLLFFAFVSITLTWAQDEFRVMSYNIRLSSGNDGSNSWKYRKEATARMLKEERPALLGTQEMLPDQVKYLDKNLSGYGRCGVGRDNGKKKGEMMAVYYDRSLFSLVDWGTFWLSETPDKVSKGWDAACKRTCTWVVLDIKSQKGKKDTKVSRVLFLNTHLDHRGTRARQEGVRLIAERIEALTARYCKEGQQMPVLLTADFNVTSNHPMFDVLKTKLSEARYVAPVSDRNFTFNNWGKVQQQLEANGYNLTDLQLDENGNTNNDAVIDHIFCRDVTPLVFRVHRGDYGVPFISDHYPVSLDFKVNY